MQSIAHLPLYECPNCRGKRFKLSPENQRELFCWNCDTHFTVPASAYYAVRSLEARSGIFNIFPIPLITAKFIGLPEADFQPYEAHTI